MATIHNKAERGMIAKTVLMPGDPRRAEFIAKNCIDDAILVNDVRCAYCYTGSYHGKPVSVMASGMGEGSMGIYSYELFSEYEVDNIIRVGSAGGIIPSLQLGDIVLATASSTDSGYMTHYGLPGNFSPSGSFALMRKAADYMDGANIRYQAGPVFSGAAFHYSNEFFGKWAKMGILAVEMESAALYCNAAVTGKQALCMCTISDLILEGHGLSPNERETTFLNMIETALSLVEV